MVIPSLPRRPPPPDQGREQGGGGEEGQSRALPSSTSPRITLHERGGLGILAMHRYTMLHCASHRVASPGQLAASIITSHRSIASKTDSNNFLNAGYSAANGW